MKKKTFTVVIKKRPKIPKELIVFFTPETKVEVVKPGFARGYTPTTITKTYGAGTFARRKNTTQSKGGSK